MVFGSGGLARLGLVRLTGAGVLLLGVEFLDELYSGVPSIGAAEIQTRFESTYGATSLALLVVPTLVALLIEPVLFVLADRHPRRWFVCGGVLAMGLSAFAIALAPSLWVLSLALCVAYLGSGAGVNLAQATLVDAHPEARERAMTRWALLGELGDLAAPGLLAACAALQVSVRAAYFGCGVLLVVWSLLLWRPLAGDTTEGGAASEEAEEEPSVWSGMWAAVRNPELLFWLGAAALCDLLDEIVVVFAALFLRDVVGLGALDRSVVFGLSVVGALVGVVVTERLLPRWEPLRLLVGAGIACSVAFGCFLGSSSMVGASASLFAVGVFAAPMYPIASAQAYASMPGRSGAVNAAAHLFTPLTLAVPWLLGVVADEAGIVVALTLLLVQPLGILVLASVALRRRSRAEPLS